jgi:hypothetical protein
MVIPLDHQILARHAFAVADPAALEDLPADIRSEALVPASLAASAHLMPRLIDLRAMTEERSGALLESLHQAHTSGQAPPIALLVRTELDSKEFTGYWNALQLAMPQPGQPAWLRVHDPRVLHQLLRILNPAQRRKLFVRSAAFTYWVAGEWLTAQANDAVPTSGTAAWDWVRVARIGVINRALHSAGVCDAAALSSQGALAEQLIERASARHGLVSRADMVEFARCGLSTRATFDEHPIVAASIKPDADAGEDSTLADRFALIGDDVWTELRQPSNM